MKRLYANATKPRPVRSSKIVDVAKRNLQGELTATVAINEEWSGCVNNNNPNNQAEYSDVKSHSVMAMVAESPLVQKLGQCFDDMKIIDAHFCIDVSKPPSVALELEGAILHCEYSYSTDNGVTFRVSNDPLHDQDLSNCFASAADYFNITNRYKPIDVVQVGINDGVLSNIDHLGVVFSPLFTVAAASQRSVPEGYFQAFNRGGALVRYAPPSWDQLMSFGSSIWQSKMPGASIHLSLDVKGSSNSEKMMTFPTRVLGKLSSISPMQQGGRFCPIIHHGIKLNFSGNPQDFYQLIYGSSLVIGFAQMQDPNQPNFNDDGTGFYIVPNNMMNPNCVVRINLVLNLDGAPVGPDKMYESLNYPTWRAFWDNIFDPDNLNADAFIMFNYSLSVQGFVSVRMKRLRTLPNISISNYPRIGILFNSGSQVSGLTDVGSSAGYCYIGMNGRHIIKITSISENALNNTGVALIDYLQQHIGIYFLGLVAVHSDDGFENNTNPVLKLDSVLFGKPVTQGIFNIISNSADANPNVVLAQNILNTLFANGNRYYYKLFLFELHDTNVDDVIAQPNFSLGTFSIRLTRDVSVEDNDQLVASNVNFVNDDNLGFVSTTSNSYLNVTLDSDYKV